MEASRKACYIGVWREDTFSDEILKNIAAHAQAEKGKKVKMTMNKEGLRITKQRLLKDNVVEFYPLKSIKAVTKNARNEQCVMFILADETKKYKIIALRCDSDADAIYTTNFFKQFKQNNTMTGVELRKRGDTGNWTLRDRSAHNANLHLKEVFRGQSQEDQSNGDINGNSIGSDHAVAHTKVQNGILKRSSSTTESQTLPYASMQSETITANGDGDDAMKALMAHTAVAERVAGHEVEMRGNTVKRSSVLLPNKPTLQDARVRTSQGGEAVVYSRRTSRDFAHFRQYQPVRAMSGRNSMIVKFDRESMVGTLPRQRPSSMRTVPTHHQHISSSSTIQRSIEDTYARQQPIIIQHPHQQPRSRRGSVNSMIISRNQQRPVSIHVMGGGNNLQVHQDSANGGVRF